jgi:hypothetical protein
MIKTHFLIWFLYWLLVLLMPAHSKYSSVLIGFVIQLVYVVIVGLGWVFGKNETGRSIEFSKFIGDGAFIKFFVLYISLVSVVGLMFLVYDKINIQGISVLDGLGSARVQWQNNADERSGRASSVFSVLGYVLGQGYFLIPSLLVHYKWVFNRRLTVQYAVLSLVLAICNSVITGGRSTLLLFFAFSLVALLLPRSRLFINWRLVKRLALPVVACILSAISYSCYVFLSRAGMNDIGLADYVVGWIDELTLVPEPLLMKIIDVPVLGDFLGIGILCVAYVTHSFSVTTAIWETGSEDKQLLFSTITNFIARTGLVETKDLNWFLNGKLASLPGSLLYQYGWVGLTLGSFFIGVSSGMLYRKLILTGGVPSLMLYGIFGSTIVLGPSFFALDFLMAPFMMSSIIVGYVFCSVFLKVFNKLK